VFCALTLDQQRYVDLEQSRSVPPADPSPALYALLTSSESHNNPPKPADFALPPDFPPQADPKSREARYFGELSPVRMKNLRWKWFKRILAGVKAPMYPEELSELERVARGDFPEDQDDRQKRQDSTDSPPWRFWKERPRVVNNRLLSRQARRLLAEIPILERVPSTKGSSEERFVVTKSAWAEGRQPTFVISEEDKKWIV
jgi:hypothetical protein